MPSESGYRAVCRVVRKLEHNEHYFTLWLRDATIARAVPGQFVMLQPQPQTDFSLRIPLCVHDVEDDTFAVLVRVVGQGTRRLAAVRPGDLLDVMGPLGNGFTLMAEGRALLVSGGIGYAPLRLLQRRLRPGCVTQWLHGGRTAADLFPADVLFCDEGVAARQGLVTDGLREALAASGGWDRVFACGPHAMLAACAGLCTEAGVPLEVSLEAYMACGIGVCHGCAVPAVTGGYMAVCKDGPVFNAQEVDWNE
ncbi:MAG: dihydroorotate dehydrogenase electron transfer subunit [Candidatus Cloacimonetes bacterium]|nr:dihydroorotate dehydrogenase electron transfer subunit [Candidatus Cloacimonadota bacterium]